MAEEGAATRSSSGATHIFLVHGICHGGWCWYKVATQLGSLQSPAGRPWRVVALDLAASGVDSRRLGEVATFRDYTGPLLDALRSLRDGEKAVLVGHSLGGLSVALAAEEFPEKVAAAVFLCAYMPDCTSPPASVLVEDITLGKSLMRVGAVFLEDLQVMGPLSKDRYGSVRKAYIVCKQDLAITEVYQRWMVSKNPVGEVMEIHRADHMAMLSAPNEREFFDHEFTTTCAAAAHKVSMAESPISTASARHIFLVHGLCHGGWCWYKVASRLQGLQPSSSAGRPWRVVALDLAASGIDARQLREVPTFRDYTAPLLDALRSLPDGEKAILVGHSLGGLNVALAAEEFPDKVAAAVFLCAYMPDCTSTPGSVLVEDRYGSVHKVYIIGNQDRALPEEFQRWMVSNNPVDEVKEIDGADHMAMLSTPDEVVQCIVDITEKYS
ncbi:hypothetical protein HU200_033547 [Digitaria exilis]|uniref:AB hydrolase-1 domain-containing protein n=1 Tax=Digitaria exilis TaxID=1010633 RepID=A0A835BI20_9POAL|nr:hypothetical protein HU200_033547 [Digitaria exilis]